MSDNEKRGSGITTREIIFALNKQRTEGYSQQMGTLLARKLLTKKQHGDMVAAFSDGFSTAIGTLSDMGIIIFVGADGEPEKKP